MDKPCIADLIQPCENASAEIRHVTLTPEKARFDNMLRIFEGAGREDMVNPGTYACLYVREHGLMMSDTDMEWITNQEVIEAAHGRVLIAGLGLGLILIPILAKPEVTTVTVIEKYKAVADLVLPMFLNDTNSGKLDVVIADALEWRAPRGARYETIYFDIWPTISSDNAKEMTLLKRRARKIRNPNDSWVGCWRERDARRMARVEARDLRRTFAPVGGLLKAK